MSNRKSPLHTCKTAEVKQIIICGALAARTVMSVIGKDGETYSVRGYTELLTFEMCKRRLRPSTTPSENRIMRKHSFQRCATIMLRLAICIFSDANPAKSIASPPYRYLFGIVISTKLYPCVCSTPQRTFLTFLIGRMVRQTSRCLYFCGAKQAIQIVPALSQCRLQKFRRGLLHCSASWPSQQCA